MYRRAITMVEVLVVIGIIGLLFGLSLSAIQNVRAAADKLACQNNLRQIGVAIHHYHQDYGHVPKPAIKLLSWTTDPSMLLSTLTHLLPYVEEDSTFVNAVEGCRTGIRPWFNPPHAGLIKKMKLYSCPADSRLSSTMIDADGTEAAYGSYVGVFGSGFPKGAGMFYVGAPCLKGSSFSQVKDGLSFTVMYGERPPPDTLHAGKWYPHNSRTDGYYGTLVGPDDTMYMRTYPYVGDSCVGEFTFGPGRLDNPCDRYHFWSLHPRGAFFAYGDASVRMMPYKTDINIVYALATRAGGEVVSISD